MDGRTRHRSQHRENGRHVRISESVDSAVQTSISSHSQSPSHHRRHRRATRTSTAVQAQPFPSPGLPPASTVEIMQHRKSHDNARESLDRSGTAYPKNGIFFAYGQGTDQHRSFNANVPPNEMQTQTRVHLSQAPKTHAQSESIRQSLLHHPPPPPRKSLSMYPHQRLLSTDSLLLGPTPDRFSVPALGLDGGPARPKSLAAKMRTEPQAEMLDRDRARRYMYSTEYTRSFCEPWRGRPVHPPAREPVMETKSASRVRTVRDDAAQTAWGVDEGEVEVARQAGRVKMYRDDSVQTAPLTDDETGDFEDDDSAVVDSVARGGHDDYLYPPASRVQRSEARRRVEESSRYAHAQTDRTRHNSTSAQYPRRGSPRPSPLSTSPTGHQRNHNINPTPRSQSVMATYPLGDTLASRSPYRTNSPTHPYIAPPMIRQPPTTDLHPDPTADHVWAVLASTPATQMLPVPMNRSRHARPSESIRYASTPVVEPGRDDSHGWQRKKVAPKVDPEWVPIDPLFPASLTRAQGQGDVLSSRAKALAGGWMWSASSPRSQRQRVAR
ncbi:hypothetical protein BCR44DRAFT_44981 [Catenaria anguillulae PL171]|uniref:Uncharacterized protein n=1 Tax=Catenaria anguillulae PL171 TaxID=765915 RepID=A0A1Y2HT06_9FUNG|nr:hypothetical protein BCR44DRAFT_44981 [Catenaria anguillulae PL171]